MAKKREDAAAAKAKKQKIILVIGGVLLLAVGAIQGPKLLKGSSAGTEAAPVAESGSVPAPVSSSVSSPEAGSPTLVAVSGPRATAVLAGVTIQGSGRPVADTGQLLRFNLFEAKDPFVPQETDQQPGAAEPTSAPPSDTQPTGSGSTATAGSGGSAAPAAAPAAPVTSATIVMNGKPYYVDLKKSFPQSDPLFVLVSLKPKLAKIGVAGGSFADAKTIPLVKGRKATLVNDATGARYVLKLVYTGAVPEQTESFTQAEK